MATAQPPLQLPVHHMVFTIPRTASHLLLKILNLPKQTSFHRHANHTDGYIFLPAAAPRFRHLLPGKPLQEWTEEQKSAVADAFQNSFDDWLRYIENAERLNKSTFVKEHLHWMVDPLAEAHLYGYHEDKTLAATRFQVQWDILHNSVHPSKSNMTCLPDAFLLQRVKPTILIRHPALTFPSCLRTSIDGEGISAALDQEKISQWECTLSWSLSLYKFYSEATNFDRRSFVEGVEYPIVLDAQDLADQAIVKKYAKATGLDEDKVQFAWKEAGNEELNSLGKMEKRMKSTILASNGIEKGKLEAEGLDVEQLRGAWEEEFGNVLSERLVQLVNDSMQAYETLRNVRLRV